MPAVRISLVIEVPTTKTEHFDSMVTYAVIPYWVCELSQCIACGQTILDDFKVATYNELDTQFMFHENCFSEVRG
jgi:hypothetical protein